MLECGITLNDGVGGLPLYVGVGGLPLYVREGGRLTRLCWREGGNSHVGEGGLTLLCVYLPLNQM